MCGSVGGLALEDGMSEPLLSISEITAAGMLESATSRAHWPYMGDCASHKYSLCWCRQRQGWSCQCRDGTTMSGLGCLGSRQIGQKSFSCRKDKKLAKLNPRKGCYLAA
jgi:hypothetical protein